MPSLLSDRSSHAMLLREDGVLARLGEAELHDLLRLDLDRLAGRRIAARASGLLLLDELAEAREHKALLLLLRTLDGEVKELLVDGDSLLLRDAGSLRERGHDTTLGGLLRLDHLDDHTVSQRFHRHNKAHDNEF